MVWRGGGVRYRLDEIMVHKIPAVLLLRGVEGILVFLSEFLKCLNVFHGGKVDVLCHNIIDDRGIGVEHEMIGVDWTRMRCKYIVRKIHSSIEISRLVSETRDCEEQKCWWVEYGGQEGCGIVGEVGVCLGLE